ncbi:MAG: hypothetical protein WD554_00070 [Flavobacteriaceae bacterium]
MEKKNRIIALVDFSNDTSALIRFSSVFSELIAGKVLFIHQIPGMSPALSDNASKNKIIDFEVNEALSNLKVLTREHFQKEAQHSVIHNSLLSELELLKNNEYFDWVLVGLKKPNALKKFLMGSTTIKLVDYSEVMTVAIPFNDAVFLPERLVVAVSEKYPLNNVQFSVLIKNLSGRIKEEHFITILTENDNKDNATQYLNKVSEQYKGPNNTITCFKGDNLYEDLKNYVDGKSGSFLVVQQGSRSLTDKVFRKFLINDLVYNGSNPIIILSK